MLPTYVCNYAIFMKVVIAIYSVVMLYVYVALSLLFTVYMYISIAMEKR